MVASYKLFDTHIYVEVFKLWLSWFNSPTPQNPLIDASVARISDISFIQAEL